MGKFLTNIEFINRAKDIHNNKYGYSSADYINSSIKIVIICNKHGNFEQTPNNHLSGNGCPKCAGKHVTTKEFINKARDIHNDKYDYSLVDYENCKLKIKIICSEHGEFEQTPNSHLDGNGCPKCSGLHKTTENFMNEANFIHNNKYDYSLVNYTNSQTKIIIMCPMHGKFEQTPNSHLSGKGCPLCKQSKGENKIEELLLIKNIGYVYQKIFDDCKHKRKLRFDFYLPELNICLEYDGVQHFEPIGFFGGIKCLDSQQKHDKIKNDFCSNNNINLIRIKYNENIKNKLKLNKII